uniref:(northern house mosquito) hypothetical protein n=1 Tax=Culex pipiens TaxID=7175 RepID=A0A8D8NMI8_CULPI
MLVVGLLGYPGISRWSFVDFTASGLLLLTKLISLNVVHVLHKVLGVRRNAVVILSRTALSHSSSRIVKVRRKVARRTVAIAAVVPTSVRVAALVHIQTAAAALGGKATAFRTSKVASVCRIGK